MCDVYAELKTVSLTAELDDEKPNGSSSDLLMTTPTKEDGEGGRGFGGKDISRRFERQSWRERHAEERRRLKLRFEVHVQCTLESWHATKDLQPTVPVLKAGHPVSYSCCSFRVYWVSFSSFLSIY